MKLLFHFLLWRCSIEAESERRLVRLRLLDQDHVYLGDELRVLYGVVRHILLSSREATVLEDLVQGLDLALGHPVREIHGAPPSIGPWQTGEVVNRCKSRFEDLGQVVADGVRHDRKVRMLVQEVDEDAARALRPVYSLSPAELLLVQSMDPSSLSLDLVSWHVVLVELLDGNSLLVEDGSNLDRLVVT